MHGTRFRAQGKAEAPSESLHAASSVRVTPSESQWAAPGTADCSYDPSRATRTTSPPSQIIGCSYVAANATYDYGSLDGEETWTLEGGAAAAT